MALIHAQTLKLRHPPLVPRKQGETFTIHSQYTHARAWAINGTDAVVLGPLPPSCRLTSFLVERSNTHPSVALSFGILNGTWLNEDDSTAMAAADKLISANAETALTASASIKDCWDAGVEAEDTRSLGVVADAADGADAGWIAVTYQYIWDPAS